MMEGMLNFKLVRKKMWLSSSWVVMSKAAAFTFRDGYVQSCHLDVHGSQRAFFEIAFNELL